MPRMILRLLLGAALGLAAPAWANDTTDTSATSDTSVWLGPGFYAHHFDRNAGYRENNIGLSVELDLSPELLAQAGSFINSDRARSHYLGGAWLPLAWQGLHLGVYGGAFDGYPAMRAGGWFAAALPMLAWRGERLGVNLTVLPSYQNRLHGAVVLQALFRVW